MLDNNDKPLETVPEVVLRKRKQVDLHKREQQRVLREQKGKQHKALRTKFTRVDELIRGRKQLQQEANRLRTAKRRLERNGFDDEDNDKLILVVRLDDASSKRKMHPQVKKTLTSLGLDRLHAAVFVRQSKQMSEQLAVVKPYIFMGSPSLPSVRSLVMKRAHTLKDGQRVPVTDNTMVEDALSDVGVICVEDIIHELMQGDKETFDKITEYLAPFHLNLESRSRVKKQKGQLAEKAAREQALPRVYQDINTFVEYFN
ncbi:ribosomal protein L30p/L7e [Hesseltinella vesiculosa]|uniref:Ribosomal protein L30p/L7e n=1 Tax=Hesseltinella vesiculosa TaxID=101127 RepID=A0A1X2GNU7_9FUNG|nr:ribosomal protein L30p/L7e [Hesseltinella vesiculosa]